MKIIAITSLTAALAGATLGLAATAAAFPNNGNAADVVSSLESEGYNVTVNGIVSVPLSTCAVTDISPTLRDTDTEQDKLRTKVFVDVSCPSHD